MIFGVRSPQIWNDELRATIREPWVLLAPAPLINRNASPADGDRCLASASPHSPVVPTSRLSVIAQRTRVARLGFDGRLPPPTLAA